MKAVFGFMIVIHSWASTKDNILRAGGRAIGFRQGRLVGKVDRYNLLVLVNVRLEKDDRKRCLFEMEALLEIPTAL